MGIRRILTSLNDGMDSAAIADPPTTEADRNAEKGYGRRARYCCRMHRYTAKDRQLPSSARRPTVLALQ